MSSLEILYKDKDLLIINKPAGIASSSGKLKSVKGACHRLDNDTSGILVLARNEKAYEAMRELFSRDKVRKEYAAIVWGLLKEKGKIDFPIGKNPKSSKRVKVYRNKAEARRNKAQGAITWYEPISSSVDKTLLSIRIKTGRRHQIRAHMSAIRHPIVGDKLYKFVGARSSRPDKGGETPPLQTNRHLLHASSIEFTHPFTGKQISIQAPVPFDLNTLE